MIQTLTPALAGLIIATLCDRDRRELEALLPPGKDLGWWRDCLFQNTEAESWAAFAEDGTPVCMGGITRGSLPHLAQTWAVGTDRKHEAGVAIFRQASRLHQSWIESRGIRKFQCSCLAEDLDCEGGSVWLERLGYVEEGFLRCQGLHGEDFRLWGKVN